MIPFTQILKEQVILSPDETEFMYDAYNQMGLSKEWAIEDLQNLLEWLNELPPTLTLYRLLYLHEGDEINKEELGDHYSDNKKELLDNHYNKGSIYSDGGDKVFLLKVKVEKDQIDVLNTLHNNIMFPHEQEITLKNKGKGTILIDITNL
jgi:hypothetical protein